MARRVAGIQVRDPRAAPRREIPDIGEAGEVLSEVPSGRYGTGRRVVRVQLIRGDRGWRGGDRVQDVRLDVGRIILLGSRAMRDVPGILLHGGGRLGEAPDRAGGLCRGGERREPAARKRRLERVVGEMKRGHERRGRRSRGIGGSLVQDQQFARSKAAP